MGALKVQTAPGVWEVVGGPAPAGLDQATADTLYVKKPGDTMTGRLNISDAAGSPSVPLVMTTTGGAASLMANAGGTNWLGRLTFFDVGGIAIATEDADQPIKFLVNNVDKVIVGPSDVQINGPVGITSSSASAPLNLMKSNGKPGLNFLSTTGGGGLGYVAGDEALSTFDIAANHTVGTPVIRMINGVAESARFRADMLMVGRTVHDFVDTGHSFSTTGGLTSVSNATNGYWNLCHTSAADANGVAYFSFTRAANVKIGGIAQTNTTGVAFQTTSHAGWKGNVRDVTDDEALARVETWRPVAFQWKIDAAGNLREDGTPTGDEQIGFIAQELVAVEPTAGTTGFGTQVEQDEWMARFNAEAAAGRSLEDPEPFQPGMTDASKLVPALVAAVRALIHKVAALEGAP